MLETVAVQDASLGDYGSIVGEETLEAIQRLAAPLKGAKVLHINATPFGGGVAEILQTLVPLMRDVGLDARWQVIEGTDEFFNVTKAMHNGLQGMDSKFSAKMQDIWQRYNQINAENFEGDYDFVIIHDPQPAGLCRLTGHQQDPGWIWRCHIDTSTPNSAYWAFLAPYINDYSATVFTMEQYVGPGVDEASLTVIPPSIDPLSPKNTPMPLEQARCIVADFGIDPARPLLVQVSRFDPWKDPLGVIDAYRVVKAQLPEVQLALVGSMASDDPEGWDYYDKTVRRAGEDFDIHILHNFHGVGNPQVNAFQTAADVVIQKSTREGFGLVVTEALWKGKPVIGGNVGGIPMQVLDGQTGFLVDTPQACGEKALYLLQHAQAANAMGQAAKEHVRKHFLTTRHLVDYLKLFNRLRSS